jgi:hypothetical protein
MNNIKNNDIYDYFNAYMNFILSNKQTKNNYLEYRKNFLINYYLENNKNSNYNELEKYYFYEEDKKEQEQEKKDDYIEKRDDDVEMHYYSLCHPKFKYIINEQDEDYVEEYISVVSSTDTYITDYYDDNEYVNFEDYEIDEEYSDEEY